MLPDWARAQDKAKDNAIGWIIMSDSFGFFGGIGPILVELALVETTVF